MQNIAVIDCLCGTRLRANLKGFICPNCRKQLMLFDGKLREFEDGVIAENTEKKFVECNGIGLYNIRKRFKTNKL